MSATNVRATEAMTRLALDRRGATSNRGKPVPPREHARRHRIWTAACHLNEAAKRMDMTPAGTLLWARSQGLASEGHANALSLQEHARRRDALQRWPLPEAAKHLDLGEAALRAYARNRGLPIRKQDA